MKKDGLLSAGLSGFAVTQCKYITTLGLFVIGGTHQIKKTVIPKMLMVATYLSGIPLRAEFFQYHFLTNRHADGGSHCYCV
jgi:hypothetical protein